MEKVLEPRRAPWVPWFFKRWPPACLLFSFYYILNARTHQTASCAHWTAEVRGQLAGVGSFLPSGSPGIGLRCGHGSSWQCLSGLHPSKPCSFLLLGSFICSANDFQGPLCSPGSAPGPGTVAGNQTDGRLCTSLGLTFSCGSQAINTQIMGTQAM